MNTTQQIIESLLFYKNEPVKFSWLALRMNRKELEIRTEIDAMIPYYENRGLTLLLSSEEVSLVTGIIGSEVISELSKNNEEKELSKQALETLSIIVYKGMITKSEIDYIRGVNSIFILRNLLIRGLILKQANPQDKRSPLYTISHDLLIFLGISDINELPDYKESISKLKNLENEYYESEGKPMDNDDTIESSSE